MSPLEQAIYAAAFVLSMSEQGKHPKKAQDPVEDRVRRAEGRARALVHAHKTYAGQRMAPLRGWP